MARLHERLERLEEQLRPAVPASKPPLPAHLQGNPHVIELWDPARGHYHIIRLRFVQSDGNGRPAATAQNAEIETSWADCK